MKRSNVTDYAALREIYTYLILWQRIWQWSSFAQFLMYHLHPVQEVDAGAYLQKRNSGKYYKISNICYMPKGLYKLR